MITFKCPGCGHQYSVNDEFAGRQTRCRRCRTELSVPKTASPVTPIYLLDKSSKLRFSVPIGQTVIGRENESHLRIPIKHISRQHAMIDRESDSVYVMDLGSSNGTTVNGHRVERNERRLLADKDEIALAGSATLVVQGAQPPVVIPTTRGMLDGTVDHTESFGANGPASGGTKYEFGFEDNEIEFCRQGIGAAAASRLATRYRMISPISTGGMGRILLVQETLSGRFVALKVMLDAAMNKEAFIQQFVREAVITARLQHPHIIPVHDLGFLDGRHLYYTMSYIDGEPYSKVQKTVPLAERLRILRSAALAVSYAHEKGLWHRDLKPHNILVGPIGSTYVIDWGLVSVQPGKVYKLILPKVVVDKANLALPDNLMEQTPDAATRSGGPVLGTPAYMAPEQALGEALGMGKASDVWAFGIMLYEALTGHHPIFPSHNVMPWDLIRFCNEGKPVPRPRERDRTVPVELDALCGEMLQINPEERMRELEPFIKGLTTFLKQSGEQVFSLGVDTAREPVAPLAAHFPELSERSGREAELKLENQKLGLEVERLRMKNRLLSEVAQLGWFESKRKKELWARIADI